MHGCVTICVDVSAFYGGTNVLMLAASTNLLGSLYSLDVMDNRAV